MTPEFLHLAKELKEARESAGYTIEKLSAVTRIDKKFLLNLESGNFNFLAEVYVKAFIRTISRAISLDENLMMKKFNLAKEGKMPELSIPPAEELKIETPPEAGSEAPVHPPVEVSQTASPRYQTSELKFSDYDSPSHEAKKRKNFDIRMIIAAAAVIVVLSSVYYFFIREESVTIIDQTQSDQEVQQENVPRYEEEAPDSALTSRMAGDSLMLSFKALDSTWLKIDFDEGMTKEFYLRPGMEMVAKAKNSLTVLLGNLKGVNILYNGQPVTIDAAGKRVIRIKFDDTGHRILN